MANIFREAEEKTTIDAKVKEVPAKPAAARQKKPASAGMDLQEQKQVVREAHVELNTINRIMSGGLEEKKMGSQQSLYLDSDIIDEIERLAVINKTSKSKITNLLLRSVLFG